VKLVFLGRFREIAGAHMSDMAIPCDVKTLSGLREFLARAHPVLSEALAAARTQVAVNQVIVRDPAHPLHDSDEIAFLPPMSGG
jgi:molybdopterin synthase sulfur carrier subunit